MSMIPCLTVDLDLPTKKTELPNTNSVEAVAESNPAHYPKPEAGFLELDGLKVSLARPTYGNMQAIPENCLISALMTAGNHGARWDSNLSPDKLGWGHARNFATEGFYSGSKDADGMLWVDSDIIMPTWAIWKLLSCAAMGYDFVTGVYFNRGAPFAPIIYEYRKCINAYANVQSFPANTMWSIDGCGFGFCYTSRRVIEGIFSLPDFDPKTGWFPDTRYQKGGRGEDFNFCIAAKRAGFDIWADTSILLGHEGNPHVFTVQDHKKAHDTDDALQ